VIRAARRRILMFECWAHLRDVPALKAAGPVAYRARASCARLIEDIASLGAPEQIDRTRARAPGIGQVTSPVLSHGRRSTR
jgi:hypothetical protein